MGAARAGICCNCGGWPSAERGSVIARSTSMLRGIGIRTLFLIGVIVVVGLWLMKVAFKIAGAAIQFGIAIVLILVAVAAFTIAARKFKGR